eukprot:CAMPEP_0196583562 /NCGR_PEP_ID=MMETSP1081-20130531/43904_1 /TAXON_ID=36882 /ORGANISM="Pyramimonas amylifera, Strain CCMP720" /LENGTH=416 /DNA_ID=CAMNT_0041904491 /DNA_START=99 /DNA_END=1349 /DNA_ORIENTATION=+
MASATLSSTFTSKVAVSHANCERGNFRNSVVRSSSRRNAAPVRISCSTNQEGESEKTSTLSRRELTVTTPASIAAVAALSALPQSVRAEAFAGSDEWVQVPLPVDPGVILLDVEFVPDEPNHGFLLGTRQTLLETLDGGRTWEQRFLNSDDEGVNYRFQSISFSGNEGWIIGKPAILYHTTDSGKTWERIPLSARLPGNPILITALDNQGGAEMATDEGAIYVTANAAQTWRAAVEETVSATLNRTVSSGISGASYYTGSFATVVRSEGGDYVGVTTRGNFYMTWEVGQSYWQPHNRNSSRRIQNMGWRKDGGLWLIARGGELFYGVGDGITEDFEQRRIGSRGFGILDVGFSKGNEVWAAGGSGSLFKSVNNGDKWERIKDLDNVAANLYTVKFMNNGKTGFVLGNDGVLLRYTA